MCEMNVYEWEEGEGKVNFLSEAHQSMLGGDYFAVLMFFLWQLSTFWIPIQVTIMSFEILLIWNAYGHFKTIASAVLCDRRRTIITMFTVVTMPIWYYMIWKCRKSFVVVLEHFNERMIWTYWALLFSGILMENVFPIRWNISQLQVDFLRISLRKKAVFLQD